MSYHAFALFSVKWKTELVFLLMTEILFPSFSLPTTFPMSFSQISLSLSDFFGSQDADSELKRSC